VKINVLFFKPSGKFYTEEEIDVVVDNENFYDFAKSLTEHARVVHFTRQGFHTFARCSEHDGGWPQMIVGAP